MATSSPGSEPQEPLRGGVEVQAPETSRNHLGLSARLWSLGTLVQTGAVTYTQVA